MISSCGLSFSDCNFTSPANTFAGSAVESIQLAYTLENDISYDLPTTMHHTIMLALYVEAMPQLMRAFENSTRFETNKALSFASCLNHTPSAIFSSVLHSHGVALTG